MFKRIIYENWTDGVAEISFWLTFSVFVAIVIRALLMKKKDVDHISHLPLEDDQPGQSTNSTK
ncbi:hypothetical protein [Coraliomargarita akajimensis]|uniref:Cbb3-type cytochrome oxidase component n=1 Tax=Coraliomargarita akajimensis (strain DSM 45221 / IAM 15411 / JCM 23193 / KCTC 12865 / 04OKA010-24) TaxID=583355 RepID=D5EJ84_CORAD|nr:hypothetical protein [Coraliomargarita akajimensis]ADE54483.1 conserved hypothetical protein [Coraliomargarita akajimensis DSM 45221]